MKLEEKAAENDGNYDQQALFAANQIISLLNDSDLIGGDTQLKAKIQCLLIQMLNQNNEVK